MYHYTFKLNTWQQIRSPMPFLVSVLLVISQLALPSTIYAASSTNNYTFGSSQQLDRASVSVVRLVATYTPDILHKSTCSSPSVTGLGALVGSWPTQGSSDITNWVVTDGSLVNTAGIQCGSNPSDKVPLAKIDIYVNTAYTNGSGLLLKSLNCQNAPGTGGLFGCTDTPGIDTITCQNTSCDQGAVLIPFHLSAPQPFLSLGADTQLPESGVELSGANGTIPTSDNAAQALQFLTPMLATMGAVQNESGMPLLDGTGRFLSVNTKNPEVPGGVLTFLHAKLPPFQPAQQLQSNWESGVTAFYAHNYSAAQAAFQKSEIPNSQFRAPAAFLALPQLQSLRQTQPGRPTPTPTRGTSANGQPVNVFGLSIPYSLLLPLVITGAVIVVLLLLLISWLFIRRQRARHKEELKKFDAEQQAVAQKAARDAERIAEQERRQQGIPVAKHTVNLGTPGNPDLRCPNCGKPVQPGDVTCPNCRMPLTFSASGMNVRLAKPVGGMPPQSPSAVPQPSPIMLPSQPPVGVSSPPPAPGLIPASAIPDQPTVQMSPSLSVGKYDQDVTVPLNHGSASNGPSAPIVPLEQLSGANSRLGFVVGTRSNPGIKRQHKPNEDSLFAAQGERSNNASAQQFGLFVVADGMGGHANGQDASRLAIKTITERLMPRLSSNEPFTDDGYINLLVEGVQEANSAVHNRNMEHRADMGTTMTAALVVGMTAFVANVGDSRTYLYREPEGLRKVTNDHSVVASLVEAGIIKPDDIYTHPKRNQIYRSLGEKPMIDVDSFKVPLQPRDKLLLCSDGLWDMVRDPLIQQVLSTVPDPSQTGNALIQAALDGGGEDNVSVIVVHITDPTQLSGRPNIQLLARPDAPQYPPM